MKKLEVQVWSYIIPGMKKSMNVESISKALLDRGLNQSQLAKAVGVSPQAVTNWLKGKDFPRPATLLKLAKNLHLTFDEMVITSNEDRPIIAFRKKAGAKTTFEHISKAEGIGMLLKPLVSYLPKLKALRTLISKPSTDYETLQNIVTEIRSAIGIGEKAVLEYEHLISEFKENGAVLIPVLWGHKGNHENALHIRLPKEDVTFIFLNLDTRLEDFTFWMAHELAHVFTPDLAGDEFGEDFADAFAGALSFPQACAEEAYKDVIKTKDTSVKLDILQKYADEHLISINTIYLQIMRYADFKKLEPLSMNVGTLHAYRNVNSHCLVSEILFDPTPPKPNLYIAATENVFQSDFFRSLKMMIREKGTGASYIKQILDLSIIDAEALHKDLTH